MPLGCSVKGCPGKRTGYTNTITSIHKFPLRNPELVKIWLEKLELSAEFSSSSRVCNLHFEKSNFTSTSTCTLLLPNAVPLEFREDGERLLTTYHQPTLLDHDIKSALRKTSSLDSNRITNFEEFIEGLESNEEGEWKEHWRLFEQSDGCCFYRLSRDEYFYNVQISFKIIVDQDMRVLVYRGDNEADAKELEWLVMNSKLELWTQFHRILDYYQAEPLIQEKSNSFHLIKQALESLNKIVKSPEIDELIDPIKVRLVLALDRVDPVSDIVYAAVKLEPDDKTSLEMYDEHDVNDGENISPYEMIQKSELAEVEMMLDEEDDEMVLDEERGEFVRAGDIIVEAIEDDNDVDIEMLTQDRKTKVQRKRVLESAKKKARKPRATKDVVLTDCEHCDRKQMTKEQLKNHFYTAHDGPVWCDRCGKKYTARRGLVVHMTRHEENNKTKCPHCDVMLLPESLRRHIRTRHQGYKPHPCSICGKKFTTKTSVKEHEKKHLQMGLTTPELYQLNPGNNKLECNKCHAKFERGGRVFDSHVARCGGVALPKKRSYRYPCFICNKQFLSKVTSAEHMALKHNFIVENPEKMCFECKEEVDDPMAHAKMHNCRFACTQCGLRFIAQEKLDKHFKERHENTDRPFICELCNSSFKTANHLRSHKTSMHTSSEDKKFICEICDRRYPFQYQLNTHMNSAHSEIRRFACNFCGLRFKKLHGMKDHCLRYHGESNVYPCPDCPEKLKTLNDLKNHRQDLHGVSINVQKYHEA